MERVTGKRFMIAGTGSGCGKTTAACVILYGLKKKYGLHVEAWKSGPDYIDPMFHRRALGIGSGNLDLFFSGESMACSLLAQRAKQADISVIEGAMGYYDGIGLGQEASCHNLAEVTKTPVLLVVDAKGMGRSVLAVIHGFLTYRKHNRIAGILFNGISGRRYAALRPFVEQMGLLAIGYLPWQTEFVLESRHLGLVTADEIPYFRKKIERFYQLAADTIDWKRLLQLAERAQDLICRGIPVSEKRRNVTIGVARDEAFCFLYEDNLRYLKRQGCQIAFFSPVHDRRLPEGIAGLILCGGYPELYADKLSQNREMREAVRKAIGSGMPCIAECGGFLYLQKQLQDEKGGVHEMTGLFPGECFRADGLHHFGYVTMSLQEGSLFGQKDMTLRAHEFHYYGAGLESDRVCRAFLVEKASGDGRWLGGWADKDFYAGFPHIYFYGNENFAEGFLDRAAGYEEKKRKEGTAYGTICGNGERAGRRCDVAGT